MKAPAKTHYLRANHRETSPHRVLIFDTETMPEPVGPDILQRLALWNARLTLRHGRSIGGETVFDYQGTTAEELADRINDLAEPKSTLWVMAHNLSFDLTVTRLPVFLLERGWSLTQHALASDAPWARLRKGASRLTIANSASYLPTSVEALGVMVGTPKMALPPSGDLPGLRERCARDVEITSRAILELMDWWDQAKLGNWSLTGPATGWSAYRHIPMGVKLLIEPDAEARAFERRALLAGRREAWRVGKLPKGYYLDLDLEHAHLTVAAHKALPYQRMRHFDSLPLESPYLTLSNLDILAEVEIETETPRYPVQLPNGLFYPVGRFRTVLAGPEIREALSRGELKGIGAGYVYRVTPHMARWGRWLADVLDCPPAGATAAVGAAVKAWSRTVPGRWASHVSEVIEEYGDHRPGWWLEHGTWGVERIPVSYLTIGGRQYVLRRDVEGDDSFPAVLAFVQSWTRVLLSRCVDAVGTAVIQCNTDGLIVDANKLALRYGLRLRGTAVQPSGAEKQLGGALQAINALIAPARLRVKKTAIRVEVAGAQHVILDGDRRLAGVPRDAVEIADLKFRYWSWPSLQGQLLEGDAAGFRQKRLTSDLSHVPLNRWVLANGRTEPVRVHIAADGSNVAVPWSVGGQPATALATDRPQHPDLLLGDRNPRLFE